MVQEALIDLLSRFTNCQYFLTLLKGYDLSFVWGVKSYILLLFCFDDSLQSQKKKATVLELVPISRYLYL